MREMALLIKICKAMLYTCKYKYVQINQAKYIIRIRRIQYPNGLTM